MTRYVKKQIQLSAVALSAVLVPQANADDLFDASFLGEPVPVAPNNAAETAGEAKPAEHAAPALPVEEKKEADAYLADKLQIEEGEEIFEIRSLYYADGIPYSLNTAVLPAKRFEKLDFFDFNNRSLYEVLGSFYGTYMYRVRQTLEATTADVSVSRLLERDESQPLLRIKAISYCLEDNQEIPVEYYEAYILTDIQNYYVEKFH